jgi:hypothetical protein
MALVVVLLAVLVSAGTSAAVTKLLDNDSSQSPSIAQIHSLQRDLYHFSVRYNDLVGCLFGWDVGRVAKARTCLTDNTKVYQLEAAHLPRP